jgi:hypothetical protein
MEDEQPPAGITAADWAATPPAVRAFIRGALLVIQEHQLARLDSV